MGNVLKKSAYDELMVDSLTLRKQLDLNLAFVETTIRQIAESDAVINLNMEVIDRTSQRLIERMDLISQIYIMDSRGMQIYKSSYTDTLGDRSDREYFQKAIQGSPVFSDVIISRSTHVPITVFACPIYRNGVIDGVLGTSIDLSYLSELSSTIRSHSESYGYVVDLEGHVIGHPDQDLINGMDDYRYMPMVKDVLEGKTGIGEYSFEGVDKLVAYTPSDISGWGVLVQIPLHEAFITISLFNKLLFLTALLMLLVLFLVVVIISRRLNKPVDVIIGMIESIEQNRVLNRIDYDRNYEFGRIQKKLVSMDKTIRKYYSDLENQVEARTNQLKRSLQELENTKHELEQANERLNSISLTDALTGLPNRRALDEYWENLNCIGQRTDLRIAVLMIDIDSFKIYNDSFGHQKGDECLVQVGACLKEQFHRKVDFIARYGGEEFIICLGDLDEKGTRDIAGKLNRAVENLKIPTESTVLNGYVTISIGVAWTQNLKEKTIDDLIREADKNLYKAKAEGRNRFC